MSISITSMSVVSEIAIVPESEWRMPTLIVSSCAEAGAAVAIAAAAMRPRRGLRYENIANESPVVTGGLVGGDAESGVGQVLCHGFARWILGSRSGIAAKLSRHSPTNWAGP